METILMVQVLGALFGLLAVIFGAFGAHTLKKKLTVEQMQSYETGIKYQMYHAILLLVLGFNMGFSTTPERYMAYCFILGIIFFSFSIYGLVLSDSKGKKMAIPGTGYSPGRPLACDWLGFIDLLFPGQYVLRSMAIAVVLSASSRAGFFGGKPFSR